jgi:hypothetical protein
VRSRDQASRQDTLMLVTCDEGSGGLMGDKFPFTNFIRALKGITATHLSTLGKSLKVTKTPLPSFCGARAGKRWWRHVCEEAQRRLRLRSTPGGRRAEEESETDARLRCAMLSDGRTCVR